jgi:hypothetical protein
MQAQEIERKKRKRGPYPPLRYYKEFRKHEIRSDNPHVRALFEHLNKIRMTVMYLSYISGVKEHTIREWNRTGPTRCVPRVVVFEKALRAVGLKLAVVENKDG